MQAHVILRCADMARALAFYCEVLDFVLAYPEEESATDAIVTLRHGEAMLELCTFEGATRVPINLWVDAGTSIDDLWAKYQARGLLPPTDRESPVHQGPLTQSWGSREFYADDPDGNTLRFRQWPPAVS